MASIYFVSVMNMHEDQKGMGVTLLPVFQFFSWGTAK